jgi:hypothetical protein
MKICKIPNLVKIRQKYQSFYVKTKLHFFYASDVKLPYSDILLGSSDSQES